MTLRTNLSCECIPRMACSTPTGTVQLITATLFLGYQWWQWRCWVFREMSTLTAHRKRPLALVLLRTLWSEKVEYVLLKDTDWICSWIHEVKGSYFGSHCPHFWGILNDWHSTESFLCGLDWRKVVMTQG